MVGQVPLIILGSARQQSDTKFFVDFVFNGIEHRLTDLLSHKISFYNYNGTYPSSDRFKTIVADILTHKTIIFATPVYWYSMSGLMKNLFDRFTDLVTIQKEKGRQLKGKSIFLLAVGSDLAIPSGFEIPFKNTADYLGMHYKGCAYFSTDKNCSDNTKAETRQTFINMVEKSTTS
jgi:multimeric flavodoxin WrbA